jgi:hypothetical protein
MHTSLFYKIKATDNKHHILLLFFKDWADRVCDEVTYNDQTTELNGKYQRHHTFRVDFAREEDAVAMKLRGIPEEFKEYLTLL